MSDNTNTNMDDYIYDESKDLRKKHRAKYAQILGQKNNQNQNQNSNQTQNNQSVNINIKTNNQQMQNVNNNSNQNNKGSNLLQMLQQLQALQNTNTKNSQASQAAINNIMKRMRGYDADLLEESVDAEIRQEEAEDKQKIRTMDRQLQNSKMGVNKSQIEKAIDKLL